MRIWIVRHGESENNKKALWTGWFDAPLTDKGREDAKGAGKLLFGVNFDKVYSSDLSRAKETAEIAISGAKPIVTPLLREINVGSLAGNPLSVVSEEKRKPY